MTRSVSRNVNHKQKGAAIDRAFIAPQTAVQALPALEYRIARPSAQLRTRRAMTRSVSRNVNHKQKGAAIDRAFIAPQTAPAFCAYSHDACDSGTVRLADSSALALAAVPSRMRPAIPCVMPARRNRL
ncbi:hypothetical protein ABIE83_005374 [Bradyrhizobium diazoefficiens]